MVRFKSTQEVYSHDIFYEINPIGAVLPLRKESRAIAFRMIVFHGSGGAIA